MSMTGSPLSEERALLDAAVAFMVMMLTPTLVAVFLDPSSQPPTGDVVDPKLVDPKLAALHLAEKVEAGSFVLLPGMVLMIAYGCWRRRDLLTRFSVGRVLVSYFVFAAAWIPLAMILFPYILHSLGHEFEAQDPVRYYALETHDNGLWIILFVTCVLAPVAEEVFFRGFLFRAVENASTKVVALLVTSVLFGLLHQASVAIPVGLLGLFFGYLRMKTGGVGACILAHFVHNAWTVAVLLWRPEWMIGVYDR